MDPTAKALDDLITKDAFVRRLAASLVGATEADDIAQEVYAAGLKAPPQSDRDLAPWIVQVARRIAWRGRRAAMRRNEREIAAARVEATDSTATIVEREQIRRRVVEAVLSLPQLYRHPVILRWFDDLPIKEIAARLEITEDAVKSRLKRALGMLRSALDDAVAGSRASWVAALLPLAQTKSHAVRAAGLGWIGFLMTTTKLLWASVFGLVLGAIAVLLWVQSPSETVDLGTVERDETPVIEPEVLGAPQSTGATAIAKETGGQTPEPRTPTPSTPKFSGTESDSRPGSLQIHCVHTDGSAAPDIEVAVKFGGIFDSIPAEFAAITDAGGFVRFSNLAPGQWRLSTSRGGPSEYAYVRPNAVASVEIKLRAGAMIRGIVKDPNGLPVPSADIRVASSPIEPYDRWIGKSDVEGKFLIRDFPTFGSVFATAEGFAPSAAVILPRGKTEDGARSIELSLRPGGGNVVGVVRSTSGDPIADALIFVGENSLESMKTIHVASGVGTEPGCRMARSDIDGRFAIRGVATGKWPVVVRRRGLGMWRGEAVVEAGGETILSPVLPRSATIVGTVNYDDTRPGSGVRVGNRTTNSADELFTKADAFGKFRLVDLGTEEITIEVVGEDRMKVRETFRLAEGETRVWNPVLTVGRSIRGRIVDEHGQPQRSAMVSIVADDRQGATRGGETLQSDASAKFRFASLEDRTYTITAHHGGTAGQKKVSASVNGVRPGNDEITIVLPNLDDPQPGATVVGTLVDEGDAPIAQADLYQMRKSAIRGSDHQKVLPNGSFKFTDVAAGEFEIRIVAPGFCTHRTRTMTAVVGETIDLGKIVLETGGRCAVKVSRENGGPIGDSKLVLLGQPDEHPLSYDGSIARSGTIRAGTYFLVARIPGTDVPEQSIEIKKGEVTEATIVLPPLLRRIVRISPPSATVEDAVQIVVRRDGTDILRIHPPRSQDGTYECAFDLDPGTYRIEMKERGNVIGTVPLTIRRDDPDGGPIPLQMAPR